MDFLKDNGVDIDNALELLGDIDTYNEILVDFYDEIDDRISNLVDYKNDNDMDNYSILVHAMKSDSKYLGFVKLSDMCFNHQTKSEEDDIKYISDNFDKLISEIENVKNIIEEYREKM